jgi:GT2 family glycosyltransferase
MHPLSFGVGGPRVAIVLVNWNGWADTIECLESVFRSDLPNVSVIVCDNHSSDGSLNHIKAWAEGRLDIALAADNPLRTHSFPPLPQPLPYVEYTREAAERGGDASAAVPLVLIRTGGNLGFAGGNNVGLRFLLARAKDDFVWLLNNDTVVRPDALRQLVDELYSHRMAGVAGSTLLFYDTPDVVQTLGGGSYNRWLALPEHLGAFQPASREVAAAEAVSQMAYVAGASMLVSREFLLDVGLLSEDYFLYFEELDWATRARGRYTLAYAPKSVVYHKAGESIRTDRHGMHKSWLSDYHFFRNRILFTRKFNRPMLPVVYFALVVAMLRRARRREWDRVRLIAKLCWTT